MSSGGWGVGEVVVDAAGEGSFEAADDLFFGSALGEAAGHVVAGGLVVLEADDDDAVEGGVGLAVSSPVEAVSLLGAGGGFAIEAVGVGAGGDDEVGAGLDADPGFVEEGGGGGFDQGSDIDVELFDLGGEMLV